MDKLTEQQITKAVDWWGSKINSAHFDNGDKENGGFAIALILMTKRVATDEQIQKFRDTLRGLLEKGNPFTLEVDYDPDQILSDALQSAGLISGKSALPWETVMCFHSDGTVSVAEGYGAELVEL